jgi:hypothetical protein
VWLTPIFSPGRGDSIMSIAYATLAMVAEIAPACCQPERATRRLLEPLRRVASRNDLPPSVQPIGEILPMLLAELGLEPP